MSKKNISINLAPHPESKEKYSILWEILPTDKQQVGAILMRDTQGKFYIEITTSLNKNLPSWITDFIWWALEPSLIDLTKSGMDIVQQIGGKIAPILSLAGTAIHGLEIYKKTRDKPLTEEEEKKYFASLIFEGIKPGIQATSWIAGSEFSKWFLIDYQKLLVHRDLAGMFGSGVGHATGGFIIDFIKLVYATYQAPDKIYFYSEILRLIEDYPGAFAAGACTGYLDLIALEPLMKTALFGLLNVGPLAVIATPLAPILARVIRAALIASFSYTANVAVDAAMHALHMAINDIIKTFGFKPPKKDEEEDLEDPKELAIQDQERNREALDKALEELEEFLVQRKQNSISHKEETKLSSSSNGFKLLQWFKKPNVIKELEEISIETPQLK